MSNWADRHSVTCGVCETLNDERDCTRGPGGEGSICDNCLGNLHNSTVVFSIRDAIQWPLYHLSLQEALVNCTWNTLRHWWPDGYFPYEDEWLGIVLLQPGAFVVRIYKEDNNGGA